MTPVGMTSVDVRETHSGVVLLLGDLAYKIKKNVDLGFLDFRTPQAREKACRRELELNRRLAPDVYLDVATFARAGVPDEPVLVMRRMPDDTRLAALVSTGVDVEDHLRVLARLMADFHARADRSAEISRAAGPAGLRRRWQDNLREVRQYSGSVLDDGVCERIGRLALRFVDGREALLTERAATGHAVDGHGDLIADDIFCLPDGPRVLDCLEFDDELRRLDVVDDIAFLAMDLEHLGRPGLADTLLDHYVEFSGATVVPSLWHHYIAYRAFVRAKVACIRRAQGGSDNGDAGTLARMALDHLEAGEVQLVVVGGAPGTGKSTVAAALADNAGAVLLSSDVLRREQDWPAATRYDPASKGATYTALLDRARLLLERGESVVADATWGDSAWRRQARDLAAATSSRQISIECAAPVDVAADRAQRRLLVGASRSEAGAGVSRTLAIHRDPWPEATRVDTSGSVTDSVRQALALLGPVSHDVT